MCIWSFTGKVRLRARIQVLFDYQVQPDLTKFLWGILTGLNINMEPVYSVYLGILLICLVADSQKVVIANLHKRLR